MSVCPHPVLTRLTNQLWLGSDCPLSLSSTGGHYRVQTSALHREWLCVPVLTIQLYLLSHSPHTTYHTPSIMTGSSRQEISSLRPQLANSHGAHQDSISTYSEDNSIIIRPCHRSKDNKIFLFYSFLIKPETTILYNQRLIKHNHFYNLVIRKEEENLIRLLIIPNHHIISASINNSCRL